MFFFVFLNLVGNEY
uniref:Uncharacterized protein n=1 Tax=Anguilla anguilla TaxID=7936 RepID=A0A0E9R134_ANGAN